MDHLRRPVIELPADLLRNSGVHAVAVQNIPLLINCQRSADADHEIRTYKASDRVQNAVR